MNAKNLSGTCISAVSVEENNKSKKERDADTSYAVHAIEFKNNKGKQ